MNNEIMVDHTALFMCRHHPRNGGNCGRCSWPGNCNDGLGNILHSQKLSAGGHERCFDRIRSAIRRIINDLRAAISPAQNQRAAGMGREISCDELEDRVKHDCHAHGLRAGTSSHKGKYGCY